MRIKAIVRKLKRETPEPFFVNIPLLDLACYGRTLKVACVKAAALLAQHLSVYAQTPITLNDIKIIPGDRNDVWLKVRDAHAVLGLMIKRLLSSVPIENRKSLVPNRRLMTLIDLDNWLDNLGLEFEVSVIQRGKLPKRKRKLRRTKTTVRRRAS